MLSWTHLDRFYAISSFFKWYPVVGIIIGFIGGDCYRGVQIPILNIILIELKDSYLSKSLSLVMLSWNSTSWTVLQERLWWNLLQCTSATNGNIKLASWTTTPLPTPRKLVCQCSDFSTPGSRYSRVCRKDKPHSRYRLNVLHSTE
jgi:hypothetical protein